MSPIGTGIPVVSPLQCRGKASGLGREQKSVLQDVPDLHEGLYLSLGLPLKFSTSTGSHYWLGCGTSEMGMRGPCKEGQVVDTLHFILWATVQAGNGGF